MRCTDGHRDIIRQLAVGARSYLEVGVREGTTLEVALEHGSVERLLLCDTWDMASGGTGRGSHDHIAELLMQRGYDGAVTFLNGRSQITLKRAIRRHRRFDLTHVDGGHTYPEARADLMNVWELTERTMVVHDIAAQMPPVRRAVWGAVVEFGKVTADASAHCAFGEWGTIWFNREKA